MYCCIVDVSVCCVYYEEFLVVDGEYFEWWEMVLVNKFLLFVFVYVNIFLDGEKVVLREYEFIVEGVIQSWVEWSV